MQPALVRTPRIWLVTHNNVEAPALWQRRTDVEWVPKLQIKSRVAAFTAGGHRLEPWTYDSSLGDDDYVLVSKRDGDAVVWALFRGRN